MADRKVFNYDGEFVSFTEDGARLAIEIYGRYKEGATVEEIEDEFSLANNDPNNPHIEFRIIMAVMNKSGLMDTYDRVEHVYQTMDEIENIV